MKFNFHNVLKIRTETKKNQLTSIKYDAIMQNPLCVSQKCLSAAIHSLFDVTLQQGQIHGMCHIFSILWEFCYINCLPKWLSL